MKKEVQSKVCKHCGYCEECGRAKAAPYHPYPVYPYGWPINYPYPWYQYYQSPTWTVSSGNINSQQSVGSTYNNLVSST